MRRTDRRAALRQGGQHLDVRAEQHARDAALRRAPGDLHRRGLRGGQAADQKRAGRVAQAGNLRRDVQLLRVAVHHGAADRIGTHPGSGGRIQVACAVGTRSNNAKAVRRQRGQQGDDGSSLKVLLAAGTHGGAAGADPVAHAGRCAQPGHDQIERPASGSLA